MSCPKNCGQCFGYFPSEHQDSDVSDDEQEAKDPKFANMVGKKKVGKYKKKASSVAKKEKSEDQSSFFKTGGGRLQWSTYISPITVKVKSKSKQGAEDREEALNRLSVTEGRLTAGMLNSISNLPKIHTIEILKCHLHDLPRDMGDMDQLRVVRLSHNKLKAFPEDFAKIQNIECIRLDHNEIESMSPGIFREGTFLNLEVLILKFNKFNGLPNDLCAKILKHIDLSNNTIQSIPTSILRCSELEVLNVSNNCLTELPGPFVKLKKLQKLFISFNKLVELPSDIGLCKELEKIRMVGNQVRNLPHTILNSWTKHGGKLEELLVSKNPLIMPSITAFEMCDGEHIQAFRLFEETFFEDRQRQRPSDVKKGDTLFCKWPLRKDGPSTLKKLEPLPGKARDTCACCKAYDKASGGRSSSSFAWKSLDLSELAGGVPLCRDCKAIQFHSGFMFVAAGSVEGLSDTEDESVSEMKVHITSWHAPVDLVCFDMEPESKQSGLEALEVENVTLEVAQEMESEGDGGKGETRPKGYDYYFAGFEGDERAREKQIEEVRNVESTLLLIKRRMFYDLMSVNAKEAKEKNNGKCPKALKEFEDGAGSDKWNGKALVTDLDLYFNLLVFSTKPSFSTVQVLFDRWEANNKGYMNHAEWLALCEGVDPTLPDDICEKMWWLMSRRKEGRIELTDFVAAWHIHDVEIRDPWINRLTKVLRLEYYDMDIAELQSRLKAKGASEATPTTNFDEGDESATPSESEDGDVGKEAALIRIDEDCLLAEGERRILYADTARKKADAHTKKPPSRARQENETRSPGVDLYKQVSLSNAQFKELQLPAYNDGGSDDDDDDAQMSSEALSESSASLSYEFDARTFALQDESGDDCDDTKLSKAGIVKVTDDESLRQLMDLDVEMVLRSGDANLQKSRAHKDGDPFVVKAGRSDGDPKKPVRSKNYHTDVYPVRQAIRKAYRNLPHNDFVKLINFLLRGMKLMKHSLPGQDGMVYWHGDDPTFKHTMGLQGSNVYPRDLLKTMGFVALNPAKGGTVWVWPSKHLDTNRQGMTAWGQKDVPGQCPGKDRHRLDEMIRLLKSCQQALHRDVKFTGHFAEPHDG